MTIPCRILGLSLLISFGLTAPVFAGKVKAFTGENADFPRYKTYQWFPPRVLTKTGIVETHPANPVLKEVVGRQLLQKGLNEVADNADLQIQAWVLTESVPQLEAVIMAEGPGMIYGTPIATMGRYNHQGSLYLNLIDRRTKKSAWFAMTSDSLPRGELRAKLDKAATNIFKKYPKKK
jgi:Domain of unknown function (DUF4136)